MLNYTYTLKYLIAVHFWKIVNMYHGILITEKRKEPPPDSDTKPSSSVESVANSTSGSAGGKSSKRARR